MRSTTARSKDHRDEPPPPAAALARQRADAPLSLHSVTWSHSVSSARCTAAIHADPPLAATSLSCATVPVWPEGPNRVGGAGGTHRIVHLRDAHEVREGRS